MVSVRVLWPEDASSLRLECQHVQVEAVGDHLAITVGMTPLIDDGIYRFEVTLASQPSVAIDLPIVIAGARYHGATPSSPQGMNHVGLS